MQSYIVRIYRRDRRARRLVGVVEEAGVEGKRAFTSPDELWRILTASPRRAAGPPPTPSSPPSRPAGGAGP
ncbi:MAG TPA: hypothetical protein VIB60_05210 [Methylomirabilota bacterium]